MQKILHIKMGNLISHIQFNEFIKGKEFKGKSNYKSKDLKAVFNFKPLYDRRSLVISSEDMEPTEFTSMMKAAKAIAVNEGSIRYTKKNGKNILKDKNANVVFIKWC